MIARERVAGSRREAAWLARLLLTLAGSAWGIVGCTTFADPAVRTADCLVAAAKRGSWDGPREVECDPRADGAYTLVLLPRGPLDEASLRSAGASETQIDALRELRSTENPAIIVLPQTSAERPSRTTSQMFALDITAPVVLRREGPESLVFALEPGTSRPRVASVR